jgi:hypothetical protein
MFAVILGFLLVTIAFLITSVSIGDWVDWEYMDTDFEGSLLRLDEFGEVDHYPWGCVAGPNCDEDRDTYVCKTFTALLEGATAYIYLEIVSLYLMIIWIDSLLHLIFWRTVIGP